MLHKFANKILRYDEDISFQVWTEVRRATHGSINFLSLLKTNLNHIPGDFNSFSQCDLAIFNQNPELVEHLVENGGIPWQLIDRFIDILHLSTSLSSTPN